MDVLDVFKVLLAFFGGAGMLVLVPILYGFLSVRIVTVGHKGVRLRFGVEQEVFGPGLVWLRWPWPLGSLRIIPCNLQWKLLPEVVARTRDGLQLRVRSSVSYTVSGPLTLVREVLDADEQLYNECPDIIGRWIEWHTHEECCAPGTKDQLLQGIRDRAKEWGLDVKRLNIAVMEAADPHGQEVIALPARAARQAAALLVYADAAVAARAAHTSDGLDPTLLTLAAAGTRVSALATADQVARLAERTDALHARLEREEETTEGFTARSAVEHVAPGAGALIDAVSRQGA